MASDSLQTTTPYDRGFRAGCLLGCSPLICLFLLFLLCMVSFNRSFDRGRPPQEHAPLALPQIDPGILVGDLVPAAPQASKAPVYLGNDLSCVPELMLEGTRNATKAEWRDRKAFTAAAALHLNSKEEDGFLKNLLGARPDLAGLPFTMGPACRTTGDRARAFKAAAEAVRNEKGTALFSKLPGSGGGDENRQQFYQAYLAVMNQVIPTEDSTNQNSLIHALSSIPSTAATRSLAYLAVFSTDEAVRAMALKALSIRREEGSTEVLLMGLRYPWPTVAENAASAITKLKRKDLIPRLEAMLDTPDPRGPRAEVVAGREEMVAHELVRVNHLRNCMLCHAPAERGKSPDETLVAEVPVPTEALPDSRAGYGQSESNLLVRIDVTYLRQDFSAMQQATDWPTANWPSRQRFDFLVRRRVLTPAEAANLRKRLAGTSPYQRAYTRALHDLTGREFEAWAESSQQH